MEESNKVQLYEHVQAASQRHEYLFNDREQLLQDLDGNEEGQYALGKVLQVYEGVSKILEEYGSVNNGEFTPNTKAKLLLGARAGTRRFVKALGLPGEKVEQGLEKLLGEESKVPSVGKRVTDMGVTVSLCAYGAKELLKRFGPAGPLIGFGLLSGALLPAYAGRKPEMVLSMFNGVKGLIQELETGYAQKSNLDPLEEGR